MILSFAWTTPALLAGHKSVTRRRWKPRTTGQIQRAWDRGQREHQAWDKGPRAGGKRVGTIVLTHRPYLERLEDMPTEDLANEGGLWASKEEFVELFGGDSTEAVVVIRFRFVGAAD